MFVRNYRPGGEKWPYGEIVEITGPVSYRVQMLDSSIVRSHHDRLRKRSLEGELQLKPPLEKTEDSDVWVDMDGNLSDGVTAERDPSEIPDSSLVPEYGTAPELQGGSPLVNPPILPPTIAGSRRYPERGYESPLTITELIVYPSCVNDTCMVIVYFLLMIFIFKEGVVVIIVMSLVLFDSLHLCG